MNNRQLQIYEYIKNFLAGNIYSPSMREIPVPIGLKPVSTSHDPLDRLRVKGYIDFINSSPSTLQQIIR